MTLTNRTDELHAFVARIARMETESEMNARDETVFSNDDFVSTLNRLIEDARELLAP